MVVCRYLLLLGQVLDFSFSENNVGVAGRALVHVRLGNDEQDALRLADSHAGNAGNLKNENKIVKGTNHERYHANLTNNRQPSPTGPKLTLNCLCYSSAVFCLKLNN